MKRRKLLYLIVFITVLVLNCLYVDYQFFLMLIMITVVPVLSWGAFVLSRIRLRLYVMADRQAVQAGQKIKMRIKASNAFPVMVVWGQLTVQMRYSNTSKMEERELPVHAFLKKAEESNLVIEPVHCGILNVHLDELEVRDFLQLFSVRYDYNVLRRIVVFPERIVTGGSFQNGKEKEEDYFLSHLALDNTEVLDLRPYTVGDPMNRIHWKLSMTTEDYIVRQYGEAVEKRASILVDLSRYSADSFRDNLDLLYRAAYSIGGYYADRSLPARFIVWNDMAGELALLDFNDIQGLDEQMIQLMCIRCTVKAADQMDAAFDEQNIATEGVPILVTTEHYESDRYLVVNALEDNLEEILVQLE